MQTMSANVVFRISVSCSFSNIKIIITRSIDAIKNNLSYAINVNVQNSLSGGLEHLRGSRVNFHKFRFVPFLRFGASLLMSFVLKKTKYQ